MLTFTIACSAEQEITPKPDNVSSSSSGVGGSGGFTDVGGSDAVGGAGGSGDGGSSQGGQGPGAPTIVSANCTTEVSSQGFIFTYAEANFPGKNVQELALVHAVGFYVDPQGEGLPPDYLASDGGARLRFRPEWVGFYCGTKANPTFVSADFILP
ncbi:MAG: hypothetical protein KC731_37185 [Myxococcales bacterium]|nr:hypothetical protein [Myxococcales bacterium]